MLKRLLIFYLVFGFYELTIAQNDKETKIKILKTRLQDLKDTARINCLNSIAYLFSFSFAYHDYDSVSLYASPALEESRKLNYKQGILAALLALGNNEPRTNNEEAEKHLKELISISGDDSITNFALARLGNCLQNQAKFDEAIKVYTTCAEYYKKKNNLSLFANTIISLSTIYSSKGNYEMAFEYNQEALEKSKLINDTFVSIASRLFLADLYMNVGDYETAKKYINDASLFVIPKMIPKEKGSIIPTWPGRGFLSHLGNLYFHLNQYDSALYYYQYSSNGYPNAVLPKLNTAKVYLAQKKYDKALPLLKFSWKESARLCHQGMFMQSLLGLSEVYLNKKDFNSAYRFARQALNLAENKGAKLVIRNAYLLLTTINEDLGKMSKALAYHKQYMLLKDSIMNDQYKGKLFAFKQSAEEELRSSEIVLLKKQKEISEQNLKIQNQKLKQTWLLKNVLLGGLFLILLSGYILLHNISLKRKNERLQNQRMQVELKHRASDLEMRALRAQMNPHFIFNCLSSINSFILQNETEVASDYLTRFSKLIRLVLMHSQSSMILLKDELEMLRFYLDMEQLRFKNSFNYNITFTNSIDPDIILIPPLLLQPVCENAIRHGLMHKKGQGYLEIQLNRKDNLLKCIVTDNGVGRVKAAEFSSRSGEKLKSFGLKITADRLTLLNEEKSVKTGYEIEDLVKNGEVIGTRVSLFIQYKTQLPEEKKNLQYRD